MRNKQRVTQIENMVNSQNGNQCVFIFPKGIHEEKEIIRKVIDEVNKDSKDGGAVIILPDNLRATPDKMMNKVIRKVIIQEGREELLKFIRSS